MNFFCRLLACALACAGFHLNAHPDLEEAIEATTAKLIEQNYPNALLLERADLFRRHGQFNEALADIDLIEQRTNACAEVMLERAQILLDAGKIKDANAVVQTLLRNHPTICDAFIIRARCESRLGQREAAIQDFTTAINKSSAPGPDLYLERARQLALLGRLDEAVRGLDEVIAQANDASPIVLTAIEYDRQRKAFDSAIQRVNRLIKRYPVKEPWLTLRGEIWAQSGRNGEAEADFRQVLKGIEAYSPERRSLELTHALAARVQNNLARISAANPTAPHP
jgi:predicted Zn-dependent protease